MGLFAWFSSLGPSPAAVRAELWSLGVRHHGYPLEGARTELAGPDVDPGRAALLRACVRSLKKG